MNVEIYLLTILFFFVVLMVGYNTEQLDVNIGTNMNNQNINNVSNDVFRNYMTDISNIFSTKMVTKFNQSCNSTQINDQTINITGNAGAQITDSTFKNYGSLNLDCVQKTFSKNDATTMIAQSLVDKLAMINNNDFQTKLAQNATNAVMNASLNIGTTMQNINTNNFRSNYNENIQKIVHTTVNNEMVNINDQDCRSLQTLKQTINVSNNSDLLLSRTTFDNSGVGYLTCKQIGNVINSVFNSLNATLKLNSLIEQSNVSKTELGIEKVNSGLGLENYLIFAGTGAIFFILIIFISIFLILK